MSQLEDARAERIARYKEERRRQLNESTSRIINKDSSSSSSDGPRMTRASRLRAAAAAATAASDTSSTGKEPLRSPSSNLYDTSPRFKLEKDKSSKRKSNLNRSLTCEEVSNSNDDIKNRRRRRRFFPSDVLQQSLNSSSNEEKSKSDASLTASNMSPLSSPITASTTVKTITHKKSELSIHMENARKSVTASFSDNGKSNKPTIRKSITSSPKERSPRPLSDVDVNLDKELNGNLKQSNKENIKRKTDETNYSRYSMTNRKDNIIVPNSASNDVDKSKNLRISKRMDELTALTRETLARVERLANKTRESPRRELESNKKVSVSSNLNSLKALPSITTKTTDSNKTLNSKKKPIEVFDTLTSSGPVSILKRKISQEESKSVVATHTPPVTFSPNVIEPSITNRKQGILKKRRSLDESQVLRHRSCSPDVANRSILKNQRRSSLEEISRHSDLNLPSILKRKNIKNDDEDNSLNSPQGILKRKSGASSAGSSTSTQHVSITTAVILAAAEGAEMILDFNETVKPILKKKSFSDDTTSFDYSNDLKPILKKKSSTETDDSEEKPKRPILKSSRNSQDLKEYGYESGSECEVRPILKSTMRDDIPRPRLSFCADDDLTNVPDSLARRRSSIRKLQQFSELQSNAGVKLRENDRDMTKPRIVSVSELVMNFEKSTGAIPKKSSFKRNSDRCRTQPITFNELEASLNFVHSPQCEEFSRILSPTANTHNVQSLLNLSISLENDTKVNNFLSNSIQNTSIDSGEGKMSSDSAFQSLGDGLELEQSETENQTTKTARKIDDKLQMKALAIEARNIKLAKVNSDIEKYRYREGSSSSRFSTQPITVDEVQEATKISHDENCNEDSQSDEIDPLSLSLAERIKLFNAKRLDVKTPNRLDVPKRRTRFSTQPITFEEVETARYLSPQNQNDRYALGDKDNQRQRTISNAKIDVPVSPSHKFAMKHTEDNNKQLRSKNDIPDEGISSNDSDTDSDIKIIINDATSSSKCYRSRPSKSYSDHTSDESSSGGREIQSIIGREAMEKRKQLRERSHHANICKSKSQAALGDESSDNLSDGIKKSVTTSAMRRTIGELQAKLQQSGDNDWKKRIPKLNANEELNFKNLYNDELSEKSILKAKKDELDASAKSWKNRVEKSDAHNFSVAGKMQIKALPTSPISVLSTDKVRRTPKAKRFKGKDDDDNKELSSAPVSPDLEKHYFVRSCSDPVKPDSPKELDNSLKISERKVIVDRPDDEETFKSFFKSVEFMKCDDHIDVSLEDFDSVRRETDNLLVTKRMVKVQRRQAATSRNPLKILAARTDIRNEYTEILTGVAERETKRLNVEKIAKNNTNFAVEALRGLSSKEDFASVALKKPSDIKQSYSAYKSLMLLHIKGKRFVQTRLVEPKASSINQGDNYILVTPNELYNYVGAYSNIIEQSRATEVFNHIQQTGDLGCKAKNAFTIDGKLGKNGKDADKFWSLLEAENNFEIANINHPDEDEVYENNIISTNMIYNYEQGELVPFDKYWGHLPKVEILESTKTLVFDFGSEMYVWSGNKTDAEDKKGALRLAKELWNNGYDYTECAICPLTAAQALGDRQKVNTLYKAEDRPEWALFAKVTQHGETILFKEKFSDWPDFNRVIKCKENLKEKTEDTSIIIQSLNGDSLRNSTAQEPNYFIDGSHLGRGKHYFDEETKRNFEITTLDITCWTKYDNTYEKLNEFYYGHFYDCESYIIRWNYRVTVTGRELSGKPSKHLQLGRDRTVYFCWSGKNASVNDKGTAAILTVELDSENAPQQILTEGLEPPAFLQLFNGKMFVHSGKRDTEKEKNRLYMCRGEMDAETVLIEVPCTMKSLRSRTCFILVMNDKVVLWNGAKSSERTKTITESLANYICSEKPKSFNFYSDEEINLEQFGEGEESEEFLSLLGNKRQLYNSLIDSNNSYETTPRMFYFSSTSGKFKAEEIYCPFRSEYTNPYPFLQSDLYSVSQPAIFLIDNCQELWLWQGWWPERENDNEYIEQAGRSTLRWNDEKRAAMQTAIDYWKKENPNSETVPCYLVWAGLEPIAFTNLFPFWVDREDVEQINIQEGYKTGDIGLIEKELSLLTRDTYPLAELLQRPLPDGVDPRQIENYLTPEDFYEILSMTKEEFQKLNSWKQTQLKKEKGLF